MSKYWIGTYLILFFMIQASRVFAYEVQPGDTLSHIAKKAFGLPIYSSEGSLNKLLNLNPQIKNKDLIYPGFFIHTEELTTKEEIKIEEEAKDTPVEGSPTENTYSDFLEKIKNSKFQTQVGINYFRIDSKDKLTQASAQLISKVNYVFDLIWILEFRERLNGYLGFEMHIEELLPTVTSQTLDILKWQRTGYKLGVIYYFNSEINMLFEYQKNTIPIPRAISTSRLTMDQVEMNNWKIQFNWTYYRSNLFSAWTGLSANQFSPSGDSSYSVTNSLAYKLLMGLGYQSNFPIGASLFYEFGDLDSSISNQTKKSAGILFELTKQF